MAITVTVSPQKTFVSAIKPQKTSVSSINFGPNPNIALGQIVNVDASDPDDGEALIYDASTNKYIVKPIQISSNNITNIIGGTF